MWVWSKVTMIRNAWFQITGIILIAIGATIHAAYSDYPHFLDDKFLSVPSLLIAIGSIIFFIAFFGCCGAVRENYCMVLTVNRSNNTSDYSYSHWVTPWFKKAIIHPMISRDDKISIISLNYVYSDFNCCGTWFHWFQKMTKHLQ